jgi:hypothetical protein
MAAFHVFVEGATDGSSAGLSRLADAIAKHYGLPAADLLARLQKGRFRVKGNIDRPTAETYVRDLEKLGARCAIEAATAENSQRTTPIPFPAVKPPADAAPAKLPAGAVLPPRAPTPPAGSPAAALPPRTSTPPANTANTPFASGLSAAFSGEQPAADLGALGRSDGSFSLSTVDGADDQKGAGDSFGPPAGDLSASIGPAPEPKPGAAKGAKPAKPKDEPLDMFAPPDMQGEEFKVDLAADEDDPRKRASTPPPIADPAPATSSQKIPVTPASQKRASQPSLQAPNVPVDVVAPSSSKLGPLGDERVRFAAGIFLAILLGFVPAHFVAKMKAESAYEAIDRKVIAAQQAADTMDTYATLDKMRADQRVRKEGEQRNAAIIGFALWALVGGGIAFAWFKKIPWDTLDA